MSIHFGDLSGSIVKVPLSLLSPNSIVYSFPSRISFIPAKSSAWSRPSTVAAARTQVPSRAFSSACLSAARVVPATRSTRDTARIALPLLVAVDQREGVLQAAERLAARQQS